MQPIFTVGHSTRSQEELLALLDEQRIKLLVDVRRFPGSQRHPQFGAVRLAAALASHRIDYDHEVDLGGRRTSRERCSPNTAWRQAGFRAYADYMASTSFRSALARLVDRAGGRRTVILCAEAPPWRCHRRLIADALTARGVQVVHILGPGATRRHELHPRARILDDHTIVYPAADQLEL